MKYDQLVLQVIREKLEGLLSPDLVSAVIFEALEVNAGVLPSGSGLSSFFRGSLWIAISDRIGQEAADDAIEQMAMVLGLFNHTSPLVSTRQSNRPSLLATSQIEQYKDVRVAVISQSPSMELKLGASLGKKVIILPLRTTDRLGSASGELKPNVVLIDATDPPEEPAASLPPVLSSLEPGMSIAVWGGQEPYGIEMRAELDRGSFVGLRINFFDRENGVAPLFDLIRSRMA